MKRFIWLTMILLTSLTSCQQRQIEINELTVEYMDRPLGIDEAKPRFSWQMQALAGASGIYQKAYQLEVSTNDGNEVWNSQKVESDESLNIVYAGDALQPQTRYTWTVTVWDQDGKEHSAKSWFETGIMDASPALAGWDGATWIGGDANSLVFNAQATTVFKGRFEVKLDKESQSTKASFVFGANDRRLQNQYLNILGVENGHNESYLALELNTEKLGSGTAYLNVYRAGYSPEDNPETPIYSYVIPKALVNASNQYDWHEVSMEMNFGKCMVYVDGKAVNEDPNLPPWVDVPGDSFNPLGDNGGDLIVYPVVGDIGFKLEAGQKAAFRDIEINNFRAPSNALFEEELTDDYQGIFKGKVQVQDGAYLLGSDESVLVTADPSRNATPMLRSEFTLNKQVAAARLYVTARGIYEAYVNGTRVSDDYFNPGLTQYNKTHMYQTYDVTELVSSGENAIGAMLSEGWWSGNITYRGYNWNYFGDRQSLLAKLVVIYDDGTTEVITTNPEKWKYYNDGPIRYSSFFQGELYDARKEELIQGWSTTAYDDAAWEPAVEVPLDKSTAFITEEFNYEDQQLIGQIGENAGIVKTLTAQSVEEVRPGVFVYDMGQNMVGVPQVNLTGDAGDTITMRFAEVNYPDLPEHEGYVGMIMMENIRAARATDRWILKGGEEVIQPRFTFHGFRFMEITGIEEALPLESVKGLVISSIDKLASKYETSNELVNKLWENITWSFRGNFLSIPTDTPARNERMGWNGDINVFSKTATFMGDVDPFLRRHLLANRELQTPDGRFPDIAPIGTGFGGTLWGSAGVIIPWEMYQQYGDLRVLEEHYEAMKAYLDFLKTKQNEKGILHEGPLGDWLSPEGYKNDNSLIWTAYQVRGLEIVYKSAELLGYTEDVAKYKQQYDERKAFFNDTYVNEKGQTIYSSYDGGTWASMPAEGYEVAEGKLVDSQVSYAVPLAFNVFNDTNRPKAEKQFAATISRENMDNLSQMRPEKTLMTGFIGTAAINPALSDAGRSDLAYSVLQQTKYPSWLYSVENGATTIWERLNSYTVEKGFDGNNSMNSFNHYSFGAVGSWMYNYSLGIQRGEPGFKSFVLAPTPDPTGQMTFAKGYYDSMYGRISSEWKVEGATTTYRFTVPANTNAQIKILIGENAGITAKGPLGNLETSQTEGSRQVYEVGSGQYQITVTGR
ncbi:family 78 glycoside hydrolase catalytic domain [Marinoscillum sp.]|uniref:alpha-L-rhamnosidase n=1 Tax=Marinoscillum sp. TaxID=2024838 RepID=UPI003BAA9009